MTKVTTEMTTLKRKDIKRRAWKAGESGGGSEGGGGESTVVLGPVVLLQ